MLRNNFVVVSLLLIVFVAGSFAAYQAYQYKVASSDAAEITSHLDDQQCLRKWTAVSMLQFDKNASYAADQRICKNFVSALLHGNYAEMQALQDSMTVPQCKRVWLLLRHCLESTNCGYDAIWAIPGSGVFIHGNGQGAILLHLEPGQPAAVRTAKIIVMSDGSECNDWIDSDMSPENAAAAIGKDIVRHMNATTIGK